ncbi:MAG TPA: DUF1553 domain-containing protein [Verrucomicrobiales bacterium]|nr:DUF1553 domain-containing protein [Verrucomicrobiales bacterium]
MKCPALIALVFCGAAFARAETPRSFRTDILPILTKSGCNAGACHGAATGQGGFKLSLLGYDPEEDYERITREFGGRRIAVARPEESLLLRKPSEQVEHEGGRKLRRDSHGYEVVRRWIADGAPFGSRELQVTAITVEPADNLVSEPGRKITLRVTASLSDGSQRDVTELALYSSNDEAIAGVTKSGEITVAGRGLTSIMVRCSGQVTAARVAVPFGGAVATEGDFPAQNFVDGHIGKTLHRMGLPASPLSIDAEFLRRVYLDVIGRLPAATEARDFAKEPATTQRRAECIESLLAREEFVDLWTMRLADLLLAGGKGTNGQSARIYHDWLRRQVQDRAPLDAMVRALLTATGDPAREGPANFFALSSDPRDLAEHVSRMFLGTQIACARCHAHPNDRWTQEDYHRFAAGFARIRRDGGSIQVLDRGEVEHPKTGRPLGPKPLGAPALDTADRDRRVPMAAWITSPDNPFFARSLVNRVWKHLLGRGLVEPVDDLRPTNPATHPELLDALAADFIKNHFDLRHIIRTIVSSRTYQLSSKPLAANKADDRLYSHALVRELPAQVFMDAVAQATGVPDQFPNSPEGTRAVQLASARTPSYALDVLGRCARDQSCESPVRSGGGIARALHLINGDTIQPKLRGGVLDQLFKENAGDEKILSELYLRALTRLPEPAEQAEWSAVLKKAPHRREAAEDLLWTLLNSREFGFNH